MLFGLNSRFSDDAILKAGEITSLQQEFLALEIEETEAKLGRARSSETTGRRSNRAREVSGTQREGHGQTGLAFPFRDSQGLLYDSLI